MTIETKFNKGQKVFFFRTLCQLFPVISKGTVKNVWVNRNGSIFYDIEFSVGDRRCLFKEDVEECFVFSSEKEARDSVNNCIKTEY